jgi:hypothetical protein
MGSIRAGADVETALAGVGWDQDAWRRRDLRQPGRSISRGHESFGVVKEFGIAANGKVLVIAGLA